MTSLISGFANKLYSQFPQNEHTANSARIEAQVQGLTAALTDSTSKIFKSKINETKNELNLEKESCLNSLIRLNGEFFQDPKSSLKKAWDRVVTNVQEALQLKIEFRHELENVTKALESKPKDEIVEKAQDAVGIYTSLEKKRDNIEVRLNEIIATEKTDAIAPPSEDTLRARQKELCGNYYQDPNCLLDKAWKAYQNALTQNDTSAPDLLKQYNLLENERKNNAMILQRLNSIAPAPAERSIEALTISSIQAQVNVLKQEGINEAALSGIDWKKTAVNTTIVTGIVAATGITAVYAVSNAPAATTLVVSNL